MSDRLSAGPADCRFSRSVRQCIWTPSASSGKVNKIDRLGGRLFEAADVSGRPFFYLFIVCLRAKVNQVGCDAAQKSFTVCPTGAFVRLHKVLVEFVDSRFKDLSIDLREIGSVKWDINTCWGFVQLTLLSSSLGNLVWNLTDVPSL